MITFYMKASNGDICKCGMISWLYVNYVLLIQHEGMDEQGLTYKVIDKDQFDKLRKKRAGLKVMLERVPDPEDKNRGFCGYYVQFSKA